VSAVGSHGAWAWSWAWARRLRRELPKLAVGPSILDETDTEMDEQQEEPAVGAQTETAADAAVKNAVVANQAAGGTADGAAGGATGPAPAPQEQKCRENSNVPLNKKIELKHFLAAANPSGANAGSVTDRLNLYGDETRESSNPSGELPLKGQTDAVNMAYKAAQALRLSTRVNPDMGGGEGGPCLEKISIGSFGDTNEARGGSVTTDH
jgi:hypothetical protein